MSKLAFLKRPFNGRFSIAFTLFVFSLILSFLTRLALLISVPGKQIPLAAMPGIFTIGFVYDLLVSVFVILPIIIQLVFQNEFIYRKGMFKYIFSSGLLMIFLLIISNLIPKDFSPELYIASITYLFIRLAIYALLYHKPLGARQHWRKSNIYFIVVISVFALMLNAMSEWFFWNEFSSRYNFIAVDYLVYTSEVLGNIWESYPIGVILTILLVSCIALIYTFRRNITASVIVPMRAGKRFLVLAFLLVLGWLGLLTVRGKLRHFSKNEYANSLAGNGLFEFAVAYQQNELNFTKYYKTIPDKEAFDLVKNDLRAPGVTFLNKDSFSIERDIDFTEPQHNYNVVLISVESLSAEYMQAFGNKKNITPILDSLIPHSLLFTKLFASGNRTVRGLEALALSIPPTPGQSTVKRPGNTNLFSLGSVLKSKGYTTQYLYGGDSYFDNMKTFFSGNGYAVIDRTAIPEAEVDYQNIWGVADEDLFDLAIKSFDVNSLSNKPFFAHVMTVSNHRPYTYPEGRIDISPKTQTRYGAVKYTDFAIGRFLRMASTKSWFSNTVFVIVSDHCAGSAGSVELPVTGYHIPMLIYAPGIVQPGVFDKICAQVDIPPTIMGMLKLDYRSKFFGQDLFRMNPVKHKAFISTYQGLGFLTDSNLVVQSPVGKINQYRPDFQTGNAVAVRADSSVLKEAIAYYQCANWLLKHKKQTAE